MKKHSIHLSKKCYEKSCRFIIYRGRKQKAHVLIKDYNRFMYDHTLHWVRKRFAIIVYKLSMQKKY